MFKYGMLGLGIALMLSLAWGTRVNHLRAYWKEQAQTIRIDLDSVTREVGVQSGNPGLKYDGKNPEQIIAQVQALGRDKREWQDVATVQSERIADLGEEQYRLERMLASERRKAEKLIAERNQALNRLQNLELTPQEQATCESQLKAAEDALDELFERGF